MFKGKDPTIQIDIPYFKDKNCTICNEPIRLGGFAYHNKICWGCFKTKMISIAKDARSLEDTEMVLDLLNIVELKTRT